MADLITREQAYEHLRLDYDTNGSADDAWLDVFIPAVSEAVRLWVKDPARLYESVLDSDDELVVVLDSDGQPVVRWVVKAACLVELESMYRFRSGDASVEVPATAGHGYTLGRAATALLTPLRKPTAA